MAGRLENRIAIVTGGTSGIGKAVTELFAREGAKVVFAGRNMERGKAVEDGVRSLGFEATFVVADVTIDADLDNLVAKTLEKYGRVDVLVNNAGIATRFDAAEMDPVKDYDTVFNTNIRSYMMLAKKVLPIMVGQGKGSIVNTASLAAEEGLPFHTTYSASKGAVRQYTKSLAAEYASRGVRVNCVMPGLTMTGIIKPEFLAEILPGIPMHRAAEPHEIAPAFLYFACDESSYCTGSALLVDGGKFAM